jgi:hypothetical protein
MRCGAHSHQHTGEGDGYLLTRDTITTAATPKE